MLGSVQVSYRHSDRWVARKVSQRRWPWSWNLNNKKEPNQARLSISGMGSSFCTSLPLPLFLGMPGSFIIIFVCLPGKQLLLASRPAISSSVFKTYLKYPTSSFNHWTGVLRVNKALCPCLVVYCCSAFHACFLSKACLSMVLSPMPGSQQVLIQHLLSECSCSEGWQGRAVSQGPEPRLTLLPKSLATQSSHPQPKASSQWYQEGKW